jgi:hypothetical protein
MLALCRAGTARRACAIGGFAESDGLNRHSSLHMIIWTMGNPLRALAEGIDYLLLRIVG